MRRYSMRALSRRTFLKASTATAFAIASPSFVPATALGRNGGTAPNERVTMGLIGCGSHGCGWNLDRMFQNPDQQVVAVCDVDKNYLAEAQKKTHDFYSKKFGKDYKGCKAYGDFRDVVNRKDIDAVCIVTPDHWHVLMSVFAMKAGKDVICEKPTLTIREGRLLAETQKATDRVFQTASENRSVGCYRQLVNLARNGHLGEIRHLKVLLPPGNTMARDPNKSADKRIDTPQDVPPELDYQTWLGPCPEKPYIPIRVHYNWRWDFDHSGGVLTDWGSHMVNLAQWAIGADDTGPVEVQGTGEFPEADEVWNTAVNFKLSYKYANGITMDVWSEVPGIKIEGTKGWVLSRGWRQPLKASDESLLKITFEGDKADRKDYSNPETNADMWGGGGEHRDFTNCVKSRKLCYYTAESGHRTHTINHMGNISMLLGGAKLRWNPETEKFEGDQADEANKHRCYERPQRDPWTFEKVDSWINVG